MKYGFWRSMAPIAAVVAVVFGVLVFLAFGRSHTKTVTVTQTKVETRNVVRQGRFTTPQSLFNFLHPNNAQGVKCPAWVPKNSACFTFNGVKFFVFLAMPASATHPATSAAAS